MEEPQSRAWLVSGVVACLEEGQAKELRSAASPLLLEVLEGAVKRPDDWVPTLSLIEALVLADRISGTGDFMRSWDIGHDIARSEVGPVQALAARVLRPPMLMSLAPSLFSTHFRASGRVATLPVAERSLVVSFTGFALPHRAHCFALGGWMRGFLSLGARWSIEVAHDGCICDGRSSCDYVVSWED